MEAVTNTHNDYEYNMVSLHVEHVVRNQIFLILLFIHRDFLHFREPRGIFESQLAALSWLIPAMECHRS